MNVFKIAFCFLLCSILTSCSIFKGKAETKHIEIKNESVKKVDLWGCLNELDKTQFTTSFSTTSDALIKFVYLNERTIKVFIYCDNLDDDEFVSLISYFPHIVTSDREFEHKIPPKLKKLKCDVKYFRIFKQ